MVWNNFTARILLSLTSWVLCLNLQAQSAPLTYLVSFTDKSGTPYSIDNPQAFLSPRAIERRQKHQISLDETDFPVNPNYLNALKNISGINVVATSRWFNNATVMLSDTTLLDTVLSLPFVAGIKSSSSAKPQTQPHFKLNCIQERNAIITPDSIDYGPAGNQIQMLNGDFLHQMGFTGTSMQIAVIDAGFRDLDNLPQYEHLRSTGKLIQGPDFVRRDRNVYNDGAIHGTLVVSCMAPNAKGEFIGTAPNATYYLLVSENDTSEYLVEEDYWIAAAEWADSAGADILNTSLGYTTFDDSTMNHTYSDMDGNSTRVTKGVDMAAKKGLLSVNSAGNSGTSSWYYISAPADADSCLAVGAVGPDEVYAPFSSKGPSSDGRVKPNVATQGFNSWLIWPGNVLAPGSGTSFAGPIMAGLAACLWEAFPEKSNMEIIKAIEMSSSIYNNPDDFIGHGIPDMAKAWQILSNSNYSSGLQILTLNNPFIDHFTFVFYHNTDLSLTLELFDASGKKVTVKKTDLIGQKYTYYKLDLFDQYLKAGVYVLKINDGNSISTIKLVKQ